MATDVAASANLARLAVGYGYDAAGQLLRAGESSYGYDANGNRVGPGIVTGPGNQLLSDGVWNYTYDADGNRVGKSDPATGVSWSYTYDLANRLTSATEHDAQGHLISQTTFAYDVFGHLLQQAVTTSAAAAPSVERYAYTGDQVRADLDSSNQVAPRYLDGAAVDEVLARENASGAVAWYLTDRLGSVRDLVDNAGANLDHVAYDAYGNVAGETNPTQGDRHKFQGMSFVTSVDVYYDHARDYDPGTGTWTTQDPLGFDAGDVNLGRFVGNGPTNTTDPTGLQSWSAWFGDQIRVAGATAVAFGGSITNTVVGGAKALVTGEAGQALGTRAVQIVEYQTGQAFTGTASEYGRFATAVGGDLAGTNQIVEGAGGYDLASGQELSIEDRIQRGASGVASLAGNAAGGLGLAAKAPGALPTLSRLGKSPLIGGAASTEAATAEAKAAGTAIRSTPDVIPPGEAPPSVRGLASAESIVEDELITEFYAVKNSNGGRVWVSEVETRQIGGVLETVGLEAQSGDQVTLLSGAHGTSTGELIPSLLRTCIVLSETQCMSSESAGRPGHALCSRKRNACPRSLLRRPKRCLTP